MHLRFLALPLALAASFTVTSPAWSQKAQLTAELKLKFKGVGVARMKNTITLRGATYQVSGKIQANRLVKLFANGKATYSSSGSFAGGALTPANHKLFYKQGKDRQSTEVRFVSGDAVNVIASPAIKYKKSAVPVTKAHRADTLDPISGLVFALKPGQRGTGAQVCNRSVDIFDGKERYTLRFSHKRTRKARVDGFSGPVHVCGIRYVPVAGHRPKKGSIKRLQANRGMEIEMARVGKTPIYSLFGFTIPTKAGLASGSATRFELR